MADYNCNCPPEYPNGISSLIPPFWGFSAFTPTIPLDWNIESTYEPLIIVYHAGLRNMVYTEVKITG